MTISKAAFRAAQETALYFVAAEALTNVAKYARASTATVTLRSDDRWAEITVADDGVGGAHPDQGSGLRGLADRVEALGGRLTVASAARQGNDGPRPPSHGHRPRVRDLAARRIGIATDPRSSPLGPLFRMEARGAQQGGRRFPAAVGWVKRKRARSLTSTWRRSAGNGSAVQR